MKGEAGVGREKAIREARGNVIEVVEPVGADGGGKDT